MGEIDAKRHPQHRRLLTETTGAKGCVTIFGWSVLATALLVSVLAATTHLFGSRRPVVSPTATPTLDALPPPPQPFVAAPPSTSARERFELSHREAIAQYPNLSDPETLLGREVGKEIERMTKRNDPELQSPDAPLLVTQRVATQLGIGAYESYTGRRDLVIQFVRKRNRNDPHSRIELIGGRNDDGTLWSLSLADALKAVAEHKYRFFTNGDGERIEVYVETSRAGNLFLKTKANGNDADNLLSLPEIPSR